MCKWEEPEILGYNSTPSVQFWADHVPCKWEEPGYLVHIKGLSHFSLICSLSGRQAKKQKACCLEGSIFWLSSINILLRKKRGLSWNINPAFMAS